MTVKLQGLLLAYIKENNPDLLLQLEEDDALHAWVLEKIREVELVLSSSRTMPLTEQVYLEHMTADLKPSRFKYMRDLLETEFTDVYERMQEAGTLQYEILAMLTACHELFEEMPLVEENPNPHLDHAIAQAINAYLEGAYE